MWTTGQTCLYCNPQGVDTVVVLDVHPGPPAPTVSLTLRITKSWDPERVGRKFNTTPASVLPLAPPPNISYQKRKLIREEDGMEDGNYPFALEPNKKRKISREAARVAFEERELMFPDERYGRRLKKDEALAILAKVKQKEEKLLHVLQKELQTAKYEEARFDQNESYFMRMLPVLYRFIPMLPPF